MSGILTLSEAMNADLATIPSLNPQHLELGVRQQNFGLRYHQPIHYHGQTLRIQTPAVSMTGLEYNRYACGVAVLITISPWLRQQFDILDDFVRKNLSLASHSFYKPLQCGQHIYLILDDTCAITQETDKHKMEVCHRSRPRFGKGHYSFAIEFTHVYHGQHLFGYTCSLNYRIKHVHFKPEPLE